MDTLDRSGEERRDGEGRHKWQALARFERHTVGEDQLFQPTVAQPLDGRPAQYAMCGAGVALSRAMLTHDVRRLHERASGVDLVVHDQRVTPADGADQAHRLRFAVVAGAALLDN